MLENDRDLECSYVFGGGNDFEFEVRARSYERKELLSFCSWIVRRGDAFSLIRLSGR